MAVWKTVWATKKVGWVHNGIFAPTPGSQPGKNWQEVRAVKILGWVENMTFIPYPTSCPRCHSRAIVIVEETYRDRECRYLERQDWRCTKCEHRWPLGPGRPWA